MSLPIVTRNGRVLTGSGYDRVGDFTITGTVQNDSITFLKLYRGKHSVQYTGVLKDGKVTGAFALPKAQGGASGLFELDVGLGSVLECSEGGAELQNRTIVQDNQTTFPGASQLPSAKSLKKSRH